MGWFTDCCRGIGGAVVSGCVATGKAVGSCCKVTGKAVVFCGKKIVAGAVAVGRGTKKLATYPPLIRWAFSLNAGLNRFFQAQVSLPSALKALSVVLGTAITLPVTGIISTASIVAFSAFITAYYLQGKYMEAPTTYLTSGEKDEPHYAHKILSGLAQIGQVLALSTYTAFDRIFFWYGLKDFFTMVLCELPFVPAIVIPIAAVDILIALLNRLLIEGLSSTRGLAKKITQREDTFSILDPLGRLFRHQKVQEISCHVMAIEETWAETAMPIAMLPMSLLAGDVLPNCGLGLRLACGISAAIFLALSPATYKLTQGFNALSIRENVNASLAVQGKPELPELEEPNVQPWQMPVAVTLHGIVAGSSFFLATQRKPPIAMRLSVAIATSSAVGVIDGYGTFFGEAMAITGDNPQGR